jgi:hypothetical protein
VWQWFDGLSLDDKFLVFVGQINSPVEWNEANRTFSFAITNRLEDVEVGFSAEEGEFSNLDEQLVGSAWPLCFGTTINVPCLRAFPYLSGTLARGLGFKDFTLERRIRAAEDLVCPLQFTGWSGDLTPGGHLNMQFITDPECDESKCRITEELKL